MSMTASDIKFARNLLRISHKKKVYDSSTGEAKVVDDLYLHKKVEIDRVREFVGHTPIQVLAGFLLGSGLTILFF